MLCELGKAEVKHFHIAVSPQHYIFGLDVAMHYPRRVRFGQRAGDLYRYVERFLQFNLPAAKALLERNGRLCIRLL